MRKWISRFLLCVILCFGCWFSYVYYCANQSKSYNVVIEGKASGPFGYKYVVGSGIFISRDGMILTAKHCVEDIDDLRVIFSDGQIFDVNDFCVDPNSDLAVIKLNIDIEHFAKIDSSNKLHYGDVLYGIGTANGFLDNYISFGYVYKNKFRRLYFEDNEMLLMKMKIFPGCSGGGVYHYRRLVGLMVVCQDNYSFAVSSIEIKKFLDSLNEGG